MTQADYWQKCPLCDGAGFEPVILGKHSTSATSTQICTFCKGAKVVYAPQILNGHEIYKKYKAAYPASAEPFDPSAKNIARWETALSNKAKADAITGDAILLDFCDIEALRSARAVKEYSEFPPQTQKVYQAVKEAFIGVPCFACGSRVRGDHVDFWNECDGAIRRARAKAGMRDKQESDFDFWVSGEHEAQCDIPLNSERVRTKISKKEMVELPDWDFSKLPETEHARVIELINMEAWAKLLIIHDQYKLSPYSYCCDLEGFKKWWRHGIETHKIGNSHNEQG